MTNQTRFTRPLRMQLAGSGTPGDPWRPPVPTGAIVRHEGEPPPDPMGEVIDHSGEPPFVPTGIAYVAVLAEDAQMLMEWGRVFDPLKQAVVTVPVLEPLPDNPTDEHHARWHAWLDARYAEHAGRFRPRVLSD